MSRAVLRTVGRTGQAAGERLERTGKSGMESNSPHGFDADARGAVYPFCTQEPAAASILFARYAIRGGCPDGRDPGRGQRAGAIPPDLRHSVRTDITGRYRGDAEAGERSIWRPSGRPRLR